MNAQAVRRRAGSLGVLSAVLLVGAASLAPTGVSPALAATTFVHAVQGVQSDEPAIYRRGVVIPEDRLATLRGGFNLGGMELDFGAKLTTLINNTIRYETEVAFRNAGMEVLSQTLSNAGSSAVTQVGPGSSPGTTTSTSTRSPSDNLAGSSIGGGRLDLSGLTDFSGIVIDGPGGIGSTAVLHSITRQAIVSTLATTASGQNIQNKVDIGVYVNNIGELKAAQQKARILNSLQGIVR
ncbi:hypothetical protein [Halomonas stenophila]|uniref:Uncharacterized protein n=1 Tax=Halomonas stenophila TaxID=795312 RepID=A0A7W5HL25_9GAMM|nr:hypothetical protein [Halomonas stenophila]MBB3230623.1 hypothetical protein [Halomonas stenophila]